MYLMGVLLFSIFLYFFFFTSSELVQGTGISLCGIGKGLWLTHFVPKV